MLVSSAVNDERLAWKLDPVAAKCSVTHGQRRSDPCAALYFNLNTSIDKPRHTVKQGAIQ